MALLQVTDENFDAEVRESRIPVLIDFWGPRCAPCIALDPVMVDLSEEYRDRAKIVKVVAPESRKLCGSLRVMGLPTMMAFSDG
jgi:thioredoxin 1